MLHYSSQTLRLCNTTAYTPCSCATLELTHLAVVLHYSVHTLQLCYTPCSRATLRVHTLQLCYTTAYTSRCRATLQRTYLAVVLHYSLHTLQSCYTPCSCATLQRAYLAVALHYSLIMNPSITRACARHGYINPLNVLQKLILHCQYIVQELEFMLNNAMSSYCQHIKFEPRVFKINY